MVIPNPDPQADLVKDVPVSAMYTLLKSTLALPENPGGERFADMVVRKEISAIYKMCFREIPDWVKDHKSLLPNDVWYSAVVKTSVFKWFLDPQYMHTLGWWLPGLIETITAGGISRLAREVVSIHTEENFFPQQTIAEERKAFEEGNIVAPVQAAGGNGVPAAPH